MLTKIILGACLLAVALESSSTPNGAPMFGGRIKHVIVLMFENRSFDHVLGFLRAQRKDIDGCLPSLGINCSNPMDPSSPNDNRVYVGNQARYIQPGDPNHTIYETTVQLYGVAHVGKWPPPMDGFIYSYAPYDTLANGTDRGKIIMQCFDNNSLPIINTLANEFAVIDRWYSDVPGPTIPNRLYAWMASSKGLGDDTESRVIEGFSGTNVFQMLDETYANSGSDAWRVYFQQVPSPITLDYTRTRPKQFRLIENFFMDVKSGNLPLFSWLDPGYIDLPDFPATDEHPDHDVSRGDALLKDVYESLRVSSLWNESLLVILYDEHGGFFDHVPPPYAVSPDGILANDVTPPFNFSRYGLRVPAVFVSPYIQKGFVAARPDPKNSSQYSHSSLPHTLRTQFAPNFPPFNARENISLTFENILTLTTPRTDCPIILPEVPGDPNPLYPFPRGLQPITDFQLDLTHSIAPLCGAPPYVVFQHTQNQATLGGFARDCAKFFARYGRRN